MQNFGADLRKVFGYFSLGSLYHLRQNANRLTTQCCFREFDEYEHFPQNGKGCILYLLSEPTDNQITCLAKMHSFFGQENLETPRRIIFAWDRKVLTLPLLLHHLNEIIAERETIEQESRQVEEAILL